jgi:hypothetical protein
LAALEAEVALLKEAKAKGGVPWWKANYGMFANDPMFEEAMKLGREYRESLRPKPKKKRAKGTGDAARQRSR